jgi:hypothetical protein
MQGKTIGVLRGVLTNPTQKPDQEIVNSFNRAVENIRGIGANVIENLTVRGKLPTWKVCPPARSSFKTDQVLSNEWFTRTMRTRMKQAH